MKWLDDNRRNLYERYSSQLKKYGFWIVTRTYTSQGAAINAWTDGSRETQVSAKAKAAMLGELGEELDWKDKLNSRDWAWYTAKSPAGVAVFIDGIDMTPFDWRLEGMRQSLPFQRPNSGNSSRRRSLSTSPRPPPGFLQVPDEKQPIVELQPRRTSLTPPEQEARHRKRQSLQLGERPTTWYSSDDNALADESTLRDVGMQAPLTRSRSVRSVSPSVASNVSTGKSPSLRRETRSISAGHGSSPLR